MKKIYVMSLLAVAAAAAHAEGYVGASVGRGKLPFDCQQDATCKQRVNVFKIYAGTRLKDSRQIDLGVGRVDALEVGYLRNYGRATETRMEEQQYNVIVRDPSDPTNTTNDVFTRTAPARRLVSLDALLLAPVLRVNVMPDVDLFVKAGAAIVTATVKTTKTATTAEPTEVSVKSDSQTKLKPYVALGASYAVTSGIKVFGSADWLPYSVEGINGTARAFSLGAELAF